MIGTERSPWGFFATMAFCYLYVCALFASLFGVFMAIYNEEKAYNPRMDIFDFFNFLISKLGIIMVFGQIIFALFIVITVPLLIYLRKGFSLKDYLSLENVPFKKYFSWLSMIILFQMIIIILSLFVKLAPLKVAISEAMKDIIKFDYSTLYLCFVIVVLAPVFEELLFRGFLFKGLRESKAGKWGAIIITSVIFAIIHIINVVPILILGLLFGLAREKTGTVYVPITMHVLNNFVALLLLMMFVRGYI